MTSIAVGHWTNQLVAVHACCEAVNWARQFDTFQEAWDKSQRGDHMLWWIGKTLTAGPMSAERRPLVRVACQCARLALSYVKAGEMRPLAAIELAERWANGDDSVTREQLRAAAAYAAAADYAAAAAAASADYAASAAASSAARTKALATCADIVRKHYPHAPHIRGGARKGESK